MRRIALSLVFLFLCSVPKAHAAAPTVAQARAVITESYRFMLAEIFPANNPIEIRVLKSPEGLMLAGYHKGFTAASLKSPRASRDIKKWMRMLRPELGVTGIKRVGLQGDGAFASGQFLVVPAK